jgi:hypothetical protein
MRIEIIRAYISSKNIHATNTVLINSNSANPNVKITMMLETKVTVAIAVTLNGLFVIDNETPFP